jgi:hypothetical protein
MSFLDKQPRRKPSRRYLRVFSTICVLFALVFLGLNAWFAYEQTTWSEVEAEVGRRDDGGRGADLVVGWFEPDDSVVVASVPEGDKVYAVGDKVRIRYDPDYSGDTPNARLAEEPIVQPMFFIVGGILLVVGIVMFYRAWFRTPPDTRHEAG